MIPLLHHLNSLNLILLVLIEHLHIKSRHLVKALIPFFASLTNPLYRGTNSHSWTPDPIRISYQGNDVREFF